MYNGISMQVLNIPQFGTSSYSCSIVRRQNWAYSLGSRWPKDKDCVIWLEKWPVESQTEAVWKERTVSHWFGLASIKDQFNSTQMSPCVLESFLIQRTTRVQAQCPNSVASTRIPMCKYTRITHGSTIISLLLTHPVYVCGCVGVWVRECVNWCGCVWVRDGVGVCCF